MLPILMTEPLHTLISWGLAVGIIAMAWVGGRDTETEE